jgi:hypothetical protein
MLKPPATQNNPEKHPHTYSDSDSDQKAQMTYNRTDLTAVGNCTLLKLLCLNDLFLIYLTILLQHYLLSQQHKGRMIYEWWFGNYEGGNGRGVI